MKTRTLLILLLICISLVGCDGEYNIQITDDEIAVNSAGDSTTSDAAGYQTYTDFNYGFSLSYPDNWMYKVSTDGDLLFYGTVDDQAKVSFNIQVLLSSDLGGSYSSMDDVMNDFESQYKEFDGYSKVSAGRGTVSGGSSKYHECKFINDGLNLVARFDVFENDGLFYVISYVTPASVFSKYMYIHTNTLNTFKHKESESISEPTIVKPTSKTDSSDNEDTPTVTTDVVDTTEVIETVETTQMYDCDKPNEHYDTTNHYCVCDDGHMKSTIKNECISYDDYCKELHGKYSIYEKGTPTDGFACTCMTETVKGFGGSGITCREGNDWCDMWVGSSVFSLNYSSCICDPGYFASRYADEGQQYCHEAGIAETDENYVVIYDEVIDGGPRPPTGTKTLPHPSGVSTPTPTVSEPVVKEPTPEPEPVVECLPETTYDFLYPVTWADSLASQDLSSLADHPDEANALTVYPGTTYVNSFDSTTSYDYYKITLSEPLILRIYIKGMDGKFTIGTSSLGFSPQTADAGPNYLEATFPVGTTVFWIYPEISNQNVCDDDSNCCFEISEGDACYFRSGDSCAYKDLKYNLVIDWKRP